MQTFDSNALWSQLKVDSSGLIPCIVQDAQTHHVLMVAWVSKEAFAQSVTSGLATFFSRSRQRLWQKGESSGHSQKIVEIRTDCDRDTLLYRVQAILPACHLGHDSCFAFSAADQSWQTQPEDLSTALPILARLEDTIVARQSAPAEQQSYTRTLWQAGPAAQTAKISEESAELVEALLELEHATGRDQADQDQARKHVIAEAADLVFHTLIALKHAGLHFGQVEAELSRRFGTSGIVEKNSRQQRILTNPERHEL